MLLSWFYWQCAKLLWVMKVFIIMARLFFSLWRIILANWFAVLQVQLGKFFLQYHVVWAFSAVRCYREFYLIIFSCWKPFHCGCKFKPRSCHWMKLGCNMVCCYVLLFFFFLVFLALSAPAAASFKLQFPGYSCFLFWAKCFSWLLLLLHS